MNAEVLHCIVE